MNVNTGENTGFLKQIVYRLDMMDGAADGKISASVWNNEVSYGLAFDVTKGKQINNSISNSYAINLLNNYANKIAKEDNSTAAEVLEGWSNSYNEVKMDDYNLAQKVMRTPAPKELYEVYKKESGVLIPQEMQYVNINKYKNCHNANVPSPMFANQTIKSGETSYFYDNKGYLKEIELGNGDKITYYRDENGKVKNKYVKNGQFEINYGYDTETEQLNWMTKSKGNERYLYDDKGNLIDFTITMQSDDPSQVHQKSYYADGSLNYISYNNNNSFGYDGEFFYSDSCDADGNKIHAVYDKNRKLTFLQVNNEVFYDKETIAYQ